MRFKPKRGDCRSILAAEKTTRSRARRLQDELQSNLEESMKIMEI